MEFLVVQLNSTQFVFLFAQEMVLDLQMKCAIFVNQSTITSMESHSITNVRFVMKFTKIKDQH